MLSQSAYPKIQEGSGDQWSLERRAVELGSDLGIVVHLSGYSLDCLREDGELALYRAHATQSEQPSTLLLVATASKPSLDTLGKIQHEYSLRGELDSAWALKPVTLSDRGSQVSLVLEDWGGETLDRHLSAPMEMEAFLSLAVALAATLRGLHAKKLIHKDLKPSNVLVNVTTGQVRLTGFGIASRLHREHQAPEPPELIAGTLAYMAPEQTGRMNRSIDSRSDLYALGVTLYQMVTGHLPFKASDPLEWVHSHIARYPLPPHERVNSVPACVSAIVMKLLAKTPEERYQTASGVEDDLRRCLGEWQARGCIADFPPGRHDAPDRLLIPEKLYGRANEIETLLTAFERVVCGGRVELILVSGYSGVGKSAVVNELHKPLVPPRGLFASGKFDQYKRNIPYATLAQAFRSLTRSLLSKSEAELSQWRAALQKALDPHGQLMVNLVPELQAIIGEQPPVPELPQRDAQRRFHLVFRQFIGVFARPEHPLALFLDDLQWLDAATLDLMEDLLTQPDLGHLLLIGAYRDNEVDSTHPLLRKLQAMRQAGALLQDIVLAPLTGEDLTQLVADALRCESQLAAPLANLVDDKTRGNPFFVIQFLTALFDEDLLRFHQGSRQWSWDLTRIHAKGYTDNVVSLMVGKLARLAPATQSALQQLACLGNTAELALLQVVYQDSLQQLHAQLAEAVEAGFIVRSKGSYRFLHDRVQEAAYSSIPEAGRTQAHLRIGRLLVAHTPLHEREERVFEILNQLNRGSVLIESLEEQEQLAKLNLIAARRAKASTAYASALHYLVAGVVLLSDDGWGRRPDLMFALEVHRAECEYVTGELSAAEARLGVLAARATAPVDRATVACLRSDLYTTLSQSDMAIEVCLSYLRQLGGAWPSQPTDEEVRREYERTWSLLGGRDIADLIALPLMTNPESIATLEVMNRVLPAALFTDINLLSLVLWRMVNFSLEHGHADASCYAYVHAGGLAGVLLGNYKTGFELGQLGYDLVERRGLGRFKARTYLAFAAFIVSWSKHWRLARELIPRASDAASAIGDVMWSANCRTNLIGNLLATGEPLAEVQCEAERGLEFVQKMRFGAIIDAMAAQLALIRTLRGVATAFGCLNHAEFDETQMERSLSSKTGLPFVECWYWIRKLQARFLAGDYPSAVVASLNAQRLLSLSLCFLETAEAHFYGALSHAASCDGTLPDQHQQHFMALTRHHAQLVEWAENCPENFENRVALVGAEIARIEGRVLEAEQLYERAIRSAHSNGFSNNEAIAYELAARFYAARGFHKFADTYLLEARYCYQRWGADGKVMQLERLYPHLNEESRASVPGSTIMVPAKILDLATVIKVSQSLSGEIVLEKLVDSLMRVTIQQAGAERGLLILTHHDQLVIEAEASSGVNDVEVYQRNAVADSTMLPESIVRYVVRTQQDVIVGDATSRNPFREDPYLVKNHSRSVLCLPLVNQGKLARILYLENTLSAHAFTPERISVLRVLAAQAAISLENTQLYRDLADRERKIRRLIDSNVIGIVIWDLDGRLLDANDAFLRMLQYERADLQTGLRWFDMTPPEWQAIHARVEVEELETTGMMQAREKEYFRKDGSRVPVLIGAACFEDQPDQGFAYILDLSQQKRAEEALRRSEAYLAEAQRQTHTGSCAMDGATGKTVYWSEEMFRLFGFDPEQGPPDWEQFLGQIHPEDRDRVRLASEATFRTKVNCDVEFRTAQPDGTVRHIHGIGQPVLGPSGELVQVLGTMVDVTERKRAEEAHDRVRQLEADLAHITRVSTVGELTASLAHEIKQPIGAAVTNAEACVRLIDREEPDLVEAREAALDMVKDCRRAADTIDRVRSLYQKGASQLETVELNQVIEEMVHMMAVEANRHAVTIRTDLEPTRLNLLADRVQLQQVLLNLMLNGIEAMQGRGGELAMTSQLAPDGKVLVSVSDSGVGVSAENLDKIFDAFFTTKARGTGLGLAITRTVVQSHGGQIWAEANSGGGAAFHFTLPIR